MKNPFSPDAFNVQELKRIPRDLSHRKLFTTEFGKGVPVLAQEVFPGDTVKIENVELSIQGMPTYFPLTSRLKVSVSYFLCRNRCVDDTWEDFIFNNKEIDKAWLRLDNTRAKKMISTGSLGDFLGLPSTVGSQGYAFRSYPVKSRPQVGFWMSDVFHENVSYILAHLDTSISFIASMTVGTTDFGPNVPRLFYRDLGLFDSIILDSSFANFRLVIDSVFNRSITNAGFVFCDKYFNVIHTLSTSLAANPTNPFFTVVSFSQFSEYFNDVVKSFGSCRLFLCYNHYTESSESSGHYDLTYDDFWPDPDVPVARATGYILSLSINNYSSVILDSTDDSVIADNIYVGSNPVRKIEAHAFRHYTMIGNYYYRNDRNNPYVLDGEVQYNQFIPSKASGPDENVYDFFYRNWELDRFTSCCQTPQFGDAPLVGLTYNPSLESTQLTFSATDPEGVSREYTVTVGLDSDQKLANIANFDKDIPSAVLQKVTQMITYGTSINDIRVTNSFQRFLERAQRGLRYRHQMKSHLGVSVDYPDIDIPQYIGGFNGEINSFRNDNTAASEYANLGDFNGSLFGNFSLPNPITVQVPEHGYIMGIMTIVPVPMYPQSVTNKALIKRSPFEYPLQEFMKVGNVPVHYDEVMPLQNGSGQSPDDVFGYQRPWYEYLSNLDEVHGDFRTTLTQFNCVRMFAQRPELCADFTTVHPEDLNQIFITNNIADKYGSNAKFLCKMDYKMTALRQIPDGDPALE